jgi:hypothetical protein
MNPSSTTQALLQPSPLLVFASSHASAPRFSPSPQIALQLPPWVGADRLRGGSDPEHGS